MENFGKCLINIDNSIKDALILLNEVAGIEQTLFVTNANKCLVGTLTDGDIRRSLIQGLSIADCVELAMNKTFHSFSDSNWNVEKIKQLRDQGINLIPFIDTNGRIVKVINLKRLKSFLPIDAILMAGGKGERLRPLTETTPKPLLKIGETPIIDFNINRLMSYGIENISVTVNYLKEQIEEHYSLPRNGIKVKCVQEPKFLGTIGSLKFVTKIVHDTILVMNSDLFTNIDYEDFYCHFLSHGADMSVACIPYSVSIPLGIFNLDGRNIKGVLEKPTYNYYANAGIYMIKKNMIDLIPSDTFFNATDFIELMIQQGYSVIRYPITGYWLDIGTHTEYQKAKELAKHIHLT
jgi:dTDP-glucose pyrophosphorylase